MKSYLILAIAISAAAASGLFIQASSLPPFLLATLRLLVASLAMWPLMRWRLRAERRSLTAADFRRVLPAAVLLGIHLGTWNLGVSMTSVANATLIVNLNPVAMPFAIYLLVRERITRLELIGTMVALGGVGVLTLGQADFSSTSFQGDLICAGSMLFAVGYLAIGRFRAAGMSLLLYLVPLYLTAMLVCAVPAAFELRSVERFTANDLLAVLGLGLVCTVIGHSGFNHAMVHLRSQVVATANLGQFVVAAVLAWVIYRQVPAPQFYPAAALIVVGSLIVVRGATPVARRAIARAPAEAT